MYFSMCVWMTTDRLGMLISEAVHQQTSYSCISEACDDSRCCLLLAFTSLFKTTHTLSRHPFGRTEDGGPSSYCRLICKRHPKKHEQSNVQKSRLLLLL